MTHPRPLPRSLAPLPDESLIGYLLRLAHRLDTQPARLLMLTGLTARLGLAPTALQLHIPEPHATRFAHTTRLTPPEVAALCLDPLRDRYPPLQLDYSAGTNLVRRNKELPSALGWVLTAASRYCPDCLAGDGSAIQHAHGGPWRRQWRLSVVFTCPLHQRLLHHRCPHCDAPALGRTNRATRLIPAAFLHRHPAQCVNNHALCTHRLDRDIPPIGSPATPGLTYLLDAQQRIQDELHLDHPSRLSHPQRASHTFHDLQMLVRLVRATWPLAARYASPQVDTSAINDHIDHLHRTMTQRRAAGTQVWNLPLRAGPPDDPYTCGHLLALGHDLRTTPDAVDHLLAALTATMTWESQIQPLLRMCSPTLKATAAPHVDTLKPHHRPNRRGTHQLSQRWLTTPPQAHHTRFDHRHISHYLDHQHIRPLTDLIPAADINRAMLHRYAAITAVIEATGLPRAAAARELELPPHRIQRAHWLVHTWARLHNAHSHLASATRAVINNLNASTTLIDYKRRRDALRGWTILTADWEQITKRLPHNQIAINLGSTTDRARARHLASLLLWTIITRGDYTTATLFRDRSYTRPTDHHFVSLARQLMSELGNTSDALGGRSIRMNNLLHALDPYRTQLEHTINQGT